MKDKAKTARTAGSIPCPADFSLRDELAMRLFAVRIGCDLATIRNLWNGCGLHHSDRAGWRRVADYEIAATHRILAAAGHRASAADR